jgi:hypothetical protein
MLATPFLKTAGGEERENAEGTKVQLWGSGSGRAKDGAWAVSLETQFQLGLNNSLGNPASKSPTCPPPLRSCYLQASRIHGSSEPNAPAALATSVDGNSECCSGDGQVEGVFNLKYRILCLHSWILELVSSVNLLNWFWLLRPDENSGILRFWGSRARFEPSFPDF